MKLIERLYQSAANAGLTVRCHWQLKRGAINLWT